MRTGQVINGRLHIGAPLGEGAMGVVHAGFDDALGIPVAVKVIAPHVLVGDPKAAQRLRDEAVAMGRVIHPNVVRVYDCSSTPDDELFLVMGKVSGKDLRTVLLETSVLPTAEHVRRLVRDVADGLHAAHEKGVLHRDVKPANILLEGGRLGGRAVIGDFGVSKHMDATHSGYITGTRAYMSPEACLGNRVGPTTDVFSLGCVAYECLTGSRWHTTDGRPPNWELPGRLARLRPDVPPAVGGVLERALAEAPAERQQVITQLADELDAAFAGRVLPRPRAVPSPARTPAADTHQPPYARVTPAGHGSTPLQPPPDRTAVEPPPPPVRSRRRTGAVLGGVAALLAVAVGAGVLALGGGLDDDPTPQPDAPTRSGPLLLGPTSPADEASAQRLDVAFSGCTAERLAEGMTSFLDCAEAPDGLATLHVRQWESREAMAAAFEQHFGSKVGSKYARDSCRTWAAGPAVKDAGNVSTWPEHGDIACFVNANNDAALLWQLDDAAVQLVAIWDGPDNAAVFDWWTAHRDGGVLDESAAS